MPHEDRILNSLVKIQEDTTKIREDISYLKAKDEANQKDIKDLRIELQSKFSDMSKKVSDISEKKIPQIQTDLATLKAKAAIGGAIAGSFLGVIAGLLLRAVDWIGSFFGG